MRTTSPSPPNPPFSFAFRSGGGWGTSLWILIRCRPAGRLPARHTVHSYFRCPSIPIFCLLGDILFFCVTFFCMCACDFFCIHFHFFFISFYLPDFCLEKKKQSVAPANFYKRRVRVGRRGGSHYFRDYLVYYTHVR